MKKVAHYAVFVKKVNHYAIAIKKVGHHKVVVKKVAHCVNHLLTHHFNHFQGIKFPKLLIEP